MVPELPGDDEEVEHMEEDAADVIERQREAQAAAGMASAVTSFIMLHSCGSFFCSSLCGSVCGFRAPSFLIGAG